MAIGYALSWCPLWVGLFVFMMSLTLLKRDFMWTESERWHKMSLCSVHGPEMQMCWSMTIHWIGRMTDIIHLDIEWSVATLYYCTLTVIIGCLICHGVIFVKQQYNSDWDATFTIAFLPTTYWEAVPICHHTTSILYKLQLIHYILQIICWTWLAEK